MLTRMLLGLTLLASVCVSSVAARAPNIVFMIADDLGYGDLGCFGQKKIRTPNLDQLAAEGMRFTQHYSGNAVCAPSRCVLMTGQHPGHAFIRNNRETQPEGQFPLPPEVVTLPQLLQQVGYATGGFGKWGLGGPGSTGEPLKKGFDRWFGYNCQRVAHNFYPTNLWDNDRHLKLNNSPFSPQQKFPANADPKVAASYDNYSGRDYAPDLIIEQALKFVRDNQSRPFFLFYPTTVPHLALQVPEDSLTEYLGKFEDTPYLGERGYLPHRSPRAAYAAMVTRMDRDIGRIVSLVRELKLDENTLFVFTSDNGPAHDRVGGTDSEFFGSAAGLRGEKGSLYEGGFRVPTIARWTGKVPAGKTADRISGFEDWLPTLIELAGAKSPTTLALDGLSLVPTLTGQSQPPRPFLYREFPGYGGQQCVRFGDWKLVRQNLAAGPKMPNRRPTLELYDLKNDVAEQRNVADQFPEVVARGQQILRDQHRPSAEFPFAALDGN